jgi:hypothetical protein
MHANPNTPAVTPKLTCSIHLCNGQAGTRAATDVTTATTTTNSIIVAKESRGILLGYDST